MNNISEFPEKWVILEINNENNKFHKVYATWQDRWRINSGITTVTEDENYYYFNGISGSCYKCHKNSYGLASSFGSNILDKILKNYKDNITLLDNNFNWVNFFQENNNL